jgi:hypothetical protein
MPMSTMMLFDIDEDGEPVDQKEYRSMIDSLLYLHNESRHALCHVSMRLILGFLAHIP